MISSFECEGNGMLTDFYGLWLHRSGMVHMKVTTVSGILIITMIRAQ